MKYIIGAFMISFGILAVTIVALISINIKAPSNATQWFFLAWVLLAICSYPLAKKIIRD